MALITSGVVPFSAANPRWGSCRGATTRLTPNHPNRTRRRSHRKPRQSVREVRRPPSPCGKCRLPSNKMALITSDCITHSDAPALTLSSRKFMLIHRAVGGADLRARRRLVATRHEWELLVLLSRCCWSYAPNCACRSAQCTSRISVRQVGAGGGDLCVNTAVGCKKGRRALPVRWPGGCVSV